MTEEMASAFAQAELAKEAYQQNRIEDAIQGFMAAHQAYLRSEDLAKAAEMANNLCVALLKARRPDEALSLVEGTPQIFLDLGDEHSAAMAYGNFASALEACGRLEEAETALEEASRRFRQLNQDEYFLDTQKALSQLRLRQGRTMEAMLAMQAGLEKQGRMSLKYRMLRSLLNIPSRLLRR